LDRFLPMLRLEGIEKVRNMQMELDKI